MNEDILTNIKDIQSLQKTEKELLDNLDNNQLEPSIKSDLLDKINTISQMRIKLYKSIKNDLQYSQTTDIQTDEINLNHLKNAIKYAALSNANAGGSTINDKYNKLKIIEINDYFAKKYEDHTNIVFYFIYLFLGILFVHFFYKSQLIPTAVYWGIVIIYTIFISYKFWNTLFNSYRHNNMNYDTIDFTPPSANDLSSTTTTSTTSSSTSSPWYSSSATCKGSACCSDGLIFDTSLNICVVNYDNASTYTLQNFQNYTT